MEASPLFKYYKNREPIMLENIIKDKKINKYKITSQRMFELEVEIMSKCIERLNKFGIYPLYIFDALLVNYTHQNKVESIMNDVMKEMEIYTIVGSHKTPEFINMVNLKSMMKGIAINIRRYNED
jgi:hypothetical protein